MDKDEAVETGPAVTRVLIVDDHPLVREGVRQLLQNERDLDVCGEADNAHDAMRLADETRPDIAVVDLRLKESSGLSLISQLQSNLPQVKILVVSVRDEGFYAERALRAGARGYVTKEEGSATLVTAIRQVRNGQLYVSDAVANKVMGRIAGGARASSMDGLTDRELEVFELIGGGLPTREVGKRLHISIKTVDSHREHIKAKLGLDNATELLQHAIQWVQSQERS